VLLVTIWELGEAAGPLFIAPLSESFGRYPAYNGANIVFIVGTIIVALSRHSGLLIFARFLTGLAVASNVLNPSVIGDIFRPEQRGSAMSLVLLATLVGGAIGPAIAGGIAEVADWRFVVLIAAAIALICEIAFLFLFRETYHTIILQRRAMEQEQCDADTANKLVKTITGHEVEGTGSAIWQAVTRPARVFFGSFVLQIMTLFGSIGFTFFYIMSTSLPDILHDRFGLNEAQTGLSFMSFSRSAYALAAILADKGLGVGSIAGIMVCNFAVDRIYIKMRKSHNNKALPEYRLPLLIVGACLLPIAVALYGWVAEGQWSVGLMIFAVIFLGFSLLLGVVPLMAYVVDAFGIYSASATTAVLVVRCLMGTFLPLTVGPLVEKMGYGWAFTVLAAIVLAVAPIPLLVLKFGAKWRVSSVYTKEA
jgi:MFS family permease